MSGELTALIARKLVEDWEKHGYDVFYDHGKKDDNKNVGKIVSWFGEEYNREAELSQLDIAIVKKKPDKNNSYNAIVLIEIEETNDKPKTMLGDALGTLMGSGIRFQGNLDFEIDTWTTLIILGKGPDSHQHRNNFITQNVERLAPTLNSKNKSIGKVIVKSFEEEQKLKTFLDEQIKIALKRGSEGK
jgi:hypothetical protein